MENRIIKALWGDLKGKELLKFILLASGFFFLIGAFWPLKTLKDSIFANIIGPKYIPDVKLLSLAIFFPIILCYSKLVDIFSKEKLIYIFIFIYGITGLILVYFLYHPTIGLTNLQMDPTRLLGWVFYLFVESFITLMLSLYWSFINDVTCPEAAKKGYGLIIFGMQLGGFLFTLLGNFLSYDTSKYATMAPFIALISVLMFFVIALVVFILTHFFSDKDLKGYQSIINKNQNEPEVIEDNTAVGFLEGIKVIFTRPYVMGIFGIIFFQELISTLFNFHMSFLIKTTYVDPGMVNRVFFNFALAVQAIACTFGLLGTSFFQRKFGITFCLIAYPVLFGVTIVVYLLQPTLLIVIFVMLTAKAMGYALNQPAKETLYIPTSKNIKYKSKAWIDMFGFRLAKACGSGINEIIGVCVNFSGGIALSMIVVWIFVSRLLGNFFKKTIASKDIIK